MGRVLRDVRTRQEDAYEADSGGRDSMKWELLIGDWDGENRAREREGVKAQEKNEES